MTFITQCIILVVMAITSCTVRERPKRHRAVVSLTLDLHIVASLKKEMERLGERNFSNFVEGIFECFLRDTCEGCPYYEELPEEKQVKVTGKRGAGKQITED